MNVGIKCVALGNKYESDGSSWFVVISYSYHAAGSLPVAMNDRYQVGSNNLLFIKKIFRGPACDGNIIEMFGNIIPDIRLDFAQKSTFKMLF